MDTHLQQSLRSLCLNSEWNYAVFWKLKHHDQILEKTRSVFGTWKVGKKKVRSPTFHIPNTPLVFGVLSCEDAYCHSHGKHGRSEGQCSGSLGGSHGGHFSHDALGLAVAKLRYHVYCLGEGIVGQVAATGKHRWIFADEHATNLLASSEDLDGWRAQFSAGIQTIFIAAVIPHGVVQLGSLSKVSEDPKLVDRLRDLFSTTQQNLRNMPCLPNMPTADILHRHLLDPTNAATGENQHNITERQNPNDATSSFDKSFLDVSTSSFKLSAGFELHEALGPDFLKQNYPSCWEMEKSEPVTFPDTSDGMEQSMLTSDTGADDLLEAVVASFCRKESTFKRVKSFSTSADSLLTTEKMPTLGSACYSVDHSSVLEGSMRTSTEFSSPTPSLCTAQPARPSESAKGSKKRARAGESSRPRPRDRQLIQDRIKELRELVPNGSKCSIDSLLERTVKHMLFLQSISKHAEKLNSCTRSRVGKDGCSSNEQGASWAVEVGGHMKICPIVVENLNANGQLLIEMLCEDSSHFLEIAEAIKGLGLTILKGMTERHGDKTWLRFVVEGQNNRSVHRMDILWSLVHILQAETAA